MLFQTLDDKKNCVAIYDGNQILKEIPDNLSETWNYSAYLKNKDIQYANLYCNGRSINDVCPEDLIEDWKRINHKLKAFFLSFNEAKVNLRENCFYDLVPEKFLIEYCHYKNLITRHVLDTYEKPINYDYLKNMTELINDIKYEDLNLNLDNLDQQMKQDFLQKIENKKMYIDYDLFGSITGRLSVNKNSFPILNLNKTYRAVIEPKNDWFVELDMNGAELRTAFALLGKEQIAEDHHEWSSKEIFQGKLNRTEAKNTAIAWLYNSSSKLSLEYDLSLSKYYDKAFLKKTYFKNGFVNTPFGRKIESDDYHSINYLIQSTLIDIFHTQVLKLNEKLINKESRIAFLIHDCIVLDLKEEERDLLKDLINCLSDTKFGKFPINVKIGNNYGDMKKIKLKV